MNTFDNNGRAMHKLISESFMNLLFLRPLNNDTNKWMKKPIDSQTDEERDRRLQVCLRWVLAYKEISVAGWWSTPE